MDHLILMQIADGTAELLKELEAIVQAELVLIAIAVDGAAFNILHHIERHAFRCVSSIENAGDIGVVEVGQHLTFIAKALNELGRHDVAAQQFDRHVLAESTVVANGKIDDAHAALAEFAQHPIGTDHLRAPARHHGLGRRLPRPQHLQRNFEQVFSPSASFAHGSLPFFGRKLSAIGQQLTEPFLSLWVHAESSLLFHYSMASWRGGSAHEIFIRHLYGPACASRRP